MRLIDAYAMQEKAFQMNFQGRINERELFLFNRALSEMPTIDAVPVVHGENITEENEVDQFVCSECGLILEGYIRKIIDDDDGAIDYQEYYMRYCPNCGAKMDSTQRNTFNALDALDALGKEQTDADS